MTGSQVRVVTWNLWGRYGDWRARQPAIHSCLRQADPDVVGLQEAWRSQDETQVDKISDLLGLPHVEELGPSHADPAHGLALISRWPISCRFDLALPTLGRDDHDRWALGAEVEHPGGPFRMIVTHLAWRLDDGWLRRAQVDAIVAHLQDLPRLQGPIVVVGDLNAPPDADETRLLTGKLAVGERRLVFRDAWEVAGDGEGHTWSSRNDHVAAERDPSCRLDYVMVEWRPDEPGRVLSAALVGDEPVDGMWASDHFGVVVGLDVGRVT